MPKRVRAAVDENEERLAAQPRRGAPDDATAQALKLWVVLSRAHRAIGTHAAAHAAGHGLTLAEFGALEALYHCGDMLLSDLQRRILVSSGGITFLVDRLTKKGFVTRRRCPDDRRARFASLTPEGERLVREIFPAHAARIRAVCAGLTAAEQREAAALLRTLGVAAAELPAMESDASPAAARPARSTKRGRTGGRTGGTKPALTARSSPRSPAPSSRPRAPR